MKENEITKKMLESLAAMAANLQCNDSRDGRVQLLMKWREETRIQRSNSTKEKK